MILSTKNKSTRFMPDQAHRAYGIQNWLCNRGYCLAPEAKYKVDKVMYKDLLKEFCNSQEDFDLSKVKDLGSYENYVNNRFSKFCQFCDKKFN
jgi:hypothetical protein